MLTESQPDVKACLRKCFVACQILNWADSGDWFDRELNGYPLDVSLPAHRLVRGSMLWRVPPPAIDLAIARAVEQTHSTEPTVLPEEITLEARAGIDVLLAAAQNGYSELTGETRTEYSTVRRVNYVIERYKYFSPDSFAQCLRQIESLTLRFVAQSYAYSQYGNALSDIWTEYRSLVDAKLHGLGFGDHLDTVQEGVRSSNPEHWRAAVFACRNLLADVATSLWRDPRDTYEHLKDQKERPILVTPDKFSNRLAAYIHQKGLGGTRGKFFRSEMERLAETIRSLVAFQGMAHTPMSREDARSVAIATYIVLGELVTRTDMAPVQQYGAPAPSTELE